MGTVKVWNGTTWVDNAQVWNGSSWQPIKIWDGTQWQPSAPAALTYADEVMADAPLVYYRFDETSGTVVNDASGNNHPGTYVGGPTLGTTGLLPGDPSKSATFNGTTQWVSIPYATWMNVPVATFESLIDGVSAQVQADSWVGRDPGSGGRVYQMRWESRKLSIIHFSPTNAITNVFSTTVFNSGTVYHVVVVFTGTSIDIYVNGVLDSSHPLAMGLRTDTTSLMMLMQCQADGSIHHAVGPMDEFAMYDHALTPARIQAHFAASGL